MAKSILDIVKRNLVAIGSWMQQVRATSMGIANNVKVELGTDKDAFVELTQEIADDALALENKIGRALELCKSQMKKAQQPV